MSAFPSPSRALRAVGERAVLIELESTEEVVSLHAALKKNPLPGQLEVIAGARTVLVLADSPRSARGFAALVQPMLNAHPARAEAGSKVVIETVYDGEDLAEVAGLTGLSVEGVIAAHTAQLYTAAFTGFAPGFAYLVGSDSRLQVPRRSTSRTRVPRGAVALAGEYSAVYPRESPGGWRLIGTTAAPLWVLERERPALILAGDQVQFRAVRERLEINQAAHGGSESGNSVTNPASPVNRDGGAGDCRQGMRQQVRGPGLLVLDAGMLSLIQDRGRAGQGELGVGASGALDRPSARRVNRLVGNPSGAAVIESVNGTLSVQAVGEQVLAVSGAAAPLLVLASADAQPQGAGERGAEFDGASDGDPGPAYRSLLSSAPFVLRDGQVLKIGQVSRGFRTYLGVRGGIAAPQTLGSRSTDTLSGLGPPPLRRGTFLKTGSESGLAAVGAPEIQRELPTAEEECVLEVIPGPRADWFDASALEKLCAGRWLVSAQSNRVGLRLSGEPLTRTRQGELPSEGLVSGAIQVPPSGEPVVFLADHPTTGGYPVIAVLTDQALDLAAQIPLGGQVTFRLANRT